LGGIQGTVGCRGEVGLDVEVGAGSSLGGIQGTVGCRGGKGLVVVGLRGRVG
jgi:hypothetical protein